MKWTKHAMVIKTTVLLAGLWCTTDVHAQNPQSVEAGNELPEPGIPYYHHKSRPELAVRFYDRSRDGCKWQTTSRYTDLHTEHDLRRSVLPASGTNSPTIRRRAFAGQ